MLKRYFFAASLLLFTPLLGAATAVSSATSQTPASTTVSSATVKSCQAVVNNIIFKGDDGYFNSGTQAMKVGETIEVTAQFTFYGDPEAMKDAIVELIPDAPGLKLDIVKDLEINGYTGTFTFSVTLLSDENLPIEFKVCVKDGDPDNACQVEGTSQTPTVTLDETGTSTTETSSTDSSTTETSSTSSSTTETSSTDSSTTETSSTDSSTTETSSTSSSTTETSSTSSSTTESSTTPPSSSEGKVVPPTTHSSSAPKNDGKTPTKALPQTGEERLNTMLAGTGVVLLTVSACLLGLLNKNKRTKE